MKSSQVGLLAILRIDPASWQEGIWRASGGAIAMCIELHGKIALIQANLVSKMLLLHRERKYSLSFAAQPASVVRKHWQIWINELIRWNNVTVKSPGLTRSPESP